MSGVVVRVLIRGHKGCAANPMPLTVIQTASLPGLIGISGWLLASLVLTPLPGAGPALLAPTLGALIMCAAAVRLRHHILR
jgi:hypothetical protein